jgi:hypothetical protein
VHTLLVDLRPPEGELFRAVARAARYEITRAARDGLVCEAWDGAAADRVAEFVAFFAPFAAARGLPPVDPRWLGLHAAAGAVVVSRVRAGAGDALAWHAYLVSRGRATLLHSASFYREAADPARRALVGRANRLLHWEDVRRFKAAGADTYDLGGWHPGRDDPARLRINRFKEQFGGAPARHYLTEYAPTLRGRAFLLLRRLLVGERI